MDLKLYVGPTCPYCMMVKQFIQKSGRTDVQFLDIVENEENLKTLVEVGGRQQVPCLFVDGKPMYESRDIIRWLEANPQK